MWKHVADRLREKNNISPSTGVNVELLFDEDGDGSIEITPAPTNTSLLLCCMADVVDVCRALGLTFYVNVTPVPHVVPLVRIY